MQSATLAVALAGSILVLLLHPAYALAAYIAALIWYPDYLRTTIGTLDISVGRIVVAVLLLRCLCNSQLRRNFVWSRLDTWVTLSMVIYVGIFCITRPLSAALENQGGFLMDTWLSYITVRLILTDKAALISFIKAASVPLAALAILGVVESVTHWQPFAPLFRFCPWQAPVGEVEEQLRWGLTRAAGPFSHSIMFGDCFVMFLPLIWSLRHQRGYWQTLAYVLSAMAIVGAISSMSSGPWVAVMVAIFCLAIERYKHWVRLILITLVLACILIQVVSNRPFYRVLADHLNFVGGDWWQRADLIDAAIEDFGQWWLAGYGGRDPGWGARTGMQVTDVNNEFILKGVRYGILGIIVLCAVLVTVFRGLSRALKQTTDPQLTSIYWSLGSVLSAVIVAWMGVCFFGQLPALFYSVLGIAGSSFGFAEHAAADSDRLLSTRYNNLILAYEQAKQA